MGKSDHKFAGHIMTGLSCCTCESLSVAPPAFPGLPGPVPRLAKWA